MSGVESAESRPDGADGPQERRPAPRDLVPARAPPPWVRIAPCLLGAAALLALLRFWGLGRWGLLVDEAHTLHDAM